MNRSIQLGIFGKGILFLLIGIGQNSDHGEVKHSFLFLYFKGIFRNSSFFCFHFLAYKSDI